mmetsp:Transcript_38771/g.116524  ORF Transcript_38771/g.116524 Transcript_38771/m.116524 type:complete len:232 (+) Transcript_38771:416-1111(+)
MSLLRDVGLKSILGSRTHDLVVADPDLPICPVEGHYSINKWLGLGMAPGRPEHVNEQTLYQPEIVPLRKGGIKAQNGPRTLHAVPRQTQFIHGVHVGQVKLNTGSHRAPRERVGRIFVCVSCRHSSCSPPRRPPDPEVTVSSLTALEKQHRVAPPDVSNIVDGPPETTSSSSTSTIARIQFRFLLVVGDQRPQILQEMTVSRRDAAGAKNKASLLVAVPAVGGESRGSLSG